MRVVFVLRSAEVFRVFLRFVLPMFVQYSRGFEPSSKSRLFSFLVSYLKICRRLVKGTNSTVAILAQGTLSGRSVSLPFWSRVQFPMAPFFFFYEQMLWFWCESSITYPLDTGSGPLPAWNIIPNTKYPRIWHLMRLMTRARFRFRGTDEKWKELEMVLSSYESDLRLVMSVRIDDGCWFSVWELVQHY